ncbi:hypothetical protein JQK88_16740 [Mesorhizobium caraganae]|uniref:hypothetical protein n=1 Tax=Mesorhizobium caraganae TaxID=483206 RepID=UPI001939B7EB|nr:hypothetical protein [Mesorhizobium caraganae]MBM2712836.1 hypothetical protein [Mesorhizobium caraganae]
MIEAGAVKGFTIDANIIDGLNTNGNLDNRILLSIGNLRTKNVAALMADIVAGEVKSHMTTVHDTAYAHLQSALKAHTKVWKADAKAVKDIAAALTPRESVADHASGLFQAFVDGISMGGHLLRQRNRHCRACDPILRRRSTIRRVEQET